MSETLKLTHHVDAVFGGEHVRFILARDRSSIVALEQAVGSVSAAWGRFSAGDWTMNDVRSILVQAFPRSDRPAEDALRSFLPRPTVGCISPRHETVEDHVDAVIGARPLATYAPLAGQLLTAAFIGLPTAVAVFDEDAVLLAPEPAPTS